ncbi:hypothetical protein J2125_001967 [Erwinia toletana]|uniref:Uncharacterized protein n=1 Tax=Winslowiella toletana TaxID=92490 RepID=A0ABS4P9I4_9GAMM|nr:hypothetical protein [Winslowiella toletana]
MTINKLPLFVSLLLFSGLVRAEYTVSFSGEKYHAEIKFLCDEGNVSCDKVSLKSVSLKNGSAIKLNGKR